LGHPFGGALFDLPCLAALSREHLGRHNVYRKER
jgi:hypothetical protein